MTSHQVQLTLAPNGRLVIPAAMRTALGLAAGGKLVARLVDGAIVLEPVGAAIARARAMVARYVPSNARLVDELIAERHAAAEQTMAIRYTMKTIERLSNLELKCC